MKNITTPRTLAECQFVTGYTAAEIVKPRTRIADVIFATVLGILGAVALVYGWNV